MQMTLNGAREHSLYKVCEEHFAGKIGKCSGSLNNENLHFHFGKKPEAPPSCFEIRNDVFTYRLQTFTSSKTSCMLAASGLPGNSLHCFTSWRPSALPGFFGSLKLTDLLGWDVSIHAAMHLPLQILSMSGAKIRIGRFWTATLATFPTIPSSSHASIHPNDLWSERKLTVGDTRAHRAHRAHGFIGILGVFRLRHLISIFGFCILPSEHCKSKCFHAAFMLHDASLTGDQGVKPHSQSRLRDFDVP
jgi:hypothetical protein